MKKLPILLLLLASISCGDRPKSPDVVPMRGTVVSDGDFLGNPSDMVIIGDRLVVTDILAPHVHAFDLASGRHLGSFGGEGGGPGEFRSVGDIQADLHRDGSFWMFDPDQGRMTRMELPASGGTGRALEVVNLDYPPGTMYFQTVWIGDSTFVATGIYPKGRLVVATREGRVLRTIGDDPPNPPGSDVPINVRQHAYTGPLERSPDGTRLALGTRHADQLEIYSSDGTLIRKVQGASGFLPEYAVNRRLGGVSMGTGPELRFGYVDLAATSQHIFALFSGDRRGDAPGRAQFGRQVHIFDWEGNRVSTFEFQERAVSITVDENGERLFAVHWEPQPALKVYPLRDHFPASPPARSASRP